VEVAIALTALIVSAWVAVCSWLDKAVESTEVLLRRKGEALSRYPPSTMYAAREEAKVRMEKYREEMRLSRDSYKKTERRLKKLKGLRRYCCGR